MSLQNLPLIGLIQQKMGWLNDRQTVLARNIANVSTPGFVPQDLRANDFAAALSGEMSPGLMTTNRMHIQPPSLVSGAHRTVAAPDSRASPDGNAVVIEEQMLKVSETQVDFAQAASLYKKMTGMWRMAIGSR